jgi:hypothetical protein
MSPRNTNTGGTHKADGHHTSGALADHLIYVNLVRVVSLEAFIRIANNGEL